MKFGDYLSPKGVFPYSSPGICLFQQKLLAQTNSDVLY